MSDMRSATSSFGFAKNYWSIRDLARKRLPRGLFEFIDRGSDDELALSNNVRAFDRIKFRPQTLRDVSRRSAHLELFGEEIAFPVAVAPTGSAGIVWHHGELALARAAAAAGIPFSLASRSMTSVERIAREAGGSLWFQLYILKDRELTYQVTERARAAGFTGLIVTADTPTNPSREYNERNGFSIPFKYSARGITDMLLHPHWLMDVVGRYYRDDGLPRFENMPGSPRISQGLSPEAMLCDDLTWGDVVELRNRWPGTLMIKGILHPNDARRAADSGADAVIVSNHGGRNLDSSIAPIDALPAIVEAVGSRITVLVDSGIRRGSDIAKALALGAKAVLVGRATLYGTAVAGELGARHVLDNLKREFLYTLATLGCRSPHELNTDILANDNLVRRSSRSVVSQTDENFL